MGSLVEVKSKPSNSINLRLRKIRVGREGDPGEGDVIIQQRSPTVVFRWLDNRSEAVVARVKVWMSETTKGDGLKLGSDTKFDTGQQSISNK